MEIQWKTQPSSTNNETLEQFFSGLRGNPNIDAILLMGSGATNTMDEHSDIDLAFVFRTVPENVLGVNTYVDNKFTEIYFYSIEEVKILLNKDIIEPNEKAGW